MTSVAALKVLQQAKYVPGTGFFQQHLRHLNDDVSPAALRPRESSSPLYPRPPLPKRTVCDINSAHEPQPFLQKYANVSAIEFKS